MDQDQFENAERVERIKKIIHLYSMGWTHKRIGEEMGVSRERITQLLSEVRVNWRNEFLADWNEHINRELAKIDALEAEAWKAWERSIKPAKNIKVKYGDERGQLTNLQELEFMSHDEGDTVALGIGDPKFLSQIDRCIDKRVKILGLTVKDKAQSDKQAKDQKHIDDLVANLKNGITTPDIVLKFFEADIVKQVFREAGLDSKGNKM